MGSFDRAGEVTLNRIDSANFNLGPQNAGITRGNLGARAASALVVTNDADTILGSEDRMVGYTSFYSTIFPMADNSANNERRRRASQSSATQQEPSIPPMRAKKSSCVRFLRAELRPVAG